MVELLDKAKNVLGGGESGTGANGNAPTVGQVLSLDGYGGEIETHDGEKTSLKKLVEESKAGVVLFTYPKANTPGCTTQACLFRDAYSHLTSTGLSIYGLSNDSPTSNTSFKTKQSLPYSLLCDPAQTLISAIGFQKEGNKTTRGVFVVDKSGKVLAAEPGGPQATVDVVAGLIKDGKVGTTAGSNLETAQAIQTAAAEAPISEKEDTAAFATATDTNTGGTTVEPAKMDEPPLVHTPSNSEREAATTAADVAESAAKIDKEKL